MKRLLIVVLGFSFAAGVTFGQSLTLELTNAIISESTGILPDWGRVVISVPEPTNITVGLTSSDPTEIEVTDSVTILAGTLSAPFTVTSIDDAVSDGLQSVDITATAAGYTDAIVTVDVADTGTGAADGMPRIAFDVPSIIDRFSMEAFDRNMQGSYENLHDSSGCCVKSSAAELLVILRDNSFGYIIHVYDLDGTYKRLIDLNGFSDTEGICEYDAAAERFAIVEEDLNRISFATITDATTVINQWDCDVLEMGLTFDIENKGIEGISHDPLNGCFYAVKEGSARTNMAVFRTLTNGVTTTVEVFDAERVFRASGLCTDLSDLTYDPYSGHLFILSDESKIVFECDMAGNILASRSLDDPAPDQPEGIAFSHAGKYMYVIGEPDEYYRYRLAPPTCTASEGTVAQFPVRLTSAYTSTVTVDFVVSSSNATLGVDYSPGAGTVTFAPGSVTTSIVVNILADLEIEGPEALTISLTNMVNGSPAADTVYECIISNACPPSPVLYDVPFDNMETPDTTPSFEFAGIDPDGAAGLIYQIQRSTDPAFVTGVITRSSDVDHGFENIEDGGDDSPFTEGQRVRFTVQPGSELSDSAADEAYYWRVRVKDTNADGGSGVYGAWTAVQSLRVDTGLSAVRWFQTADGQFETDALSRTTTNGLGSVAMTLPPAITNLSAESFESGVFDGDWINTGVGDDGNWLIRSGSTPSSYTGPSSAQDGTYYVYVETSGSSPMGRGNKTGILVGPAIDVDSHVSVGIDFWYHRYGTASDLGTLYFEVYDGTWHTEWFTSGNLGNVWMNQEVDLSAYSGTVQLRLRVVTGSGGSYRGDTALDNIVITGTNPPDATVVSSPINADWAGPGMQWNELVFTDDEANGSITYDVQYWDGDSWEDTAVTNRGTSPVDLSGLDRPTCKLIRLKANLAKGVGSPYLHEWAVTWRTAVVLEVESAHGAAVPAAGTHYFVPDAEITCTVANDLVPGATGVRYVCTGWTGTASVPVSGAGTNTGPFTITNDSTLTWLWKTNVYLDTETRGPGSVDAADAWFDSGTEILITASNVQYYSLSDWTGDTTGCIPAGHTLTVPMDRPRTITAEFTENLATNNTPEWWLATQYPGTNNFDAAALSDTDEDGMAAWQEYRAGTLPTNGLSALRITEIIDVPAGVNVRWLSVTGRQYALSRSSDLLVGWDAQPLASHISASGVGSTDQTDTNPSPTRAFYRIILE